MDQALMRSDNADGRPDEAPQLPAKKQSFARGSEVDKMLDAALEADGKTREDLSLDQPGVKGDKQIPDESPKPTRETAATTSESDDPIEGQQTEETPEAKAVNLKDLAETLETDVKDLYGVEITLGKDETATVGELKDMFHEFKTMKSNAEAFEADKTKHGNEVLIARRQIDGLIDAFVKSGSMTPDLMGLIESNHKETVARERRLTLAAIPEWNDATTRESDFTGMVKTGAEYGFSESEIRSETDSRKLKLMRDLTAMRERASRFKEDPPVPSRLRKTVSERTRKPTGLEQKIANARASRNHNTKLDAMVEVANSR